MAKHCYVVYSAPVPGREDEYNRWYNDQHIPDVLRVPGFTAAQRFRLDAEDATEGARYLALYEMETDDPSATLIDLQALAGTPLMVMSDAMNMGAVSASVFSAITERFVAKA